jgi:hypothetical protein
MHHIRESFWWRSSRDKGILHFWKFDGNSSFIIVRPNEEIERICKVMHSRHKSGVRTFHCLTSLYWIWSFICLKVESKADENDWTLFVTATVIRLMIQRTGSLSLSSSSTCYVAHSIEGIKNRKVIICPVVKLIMWLCLRQKKKSDPLKFNWKSRDLFENSYFCEYGQSWFNLYSWELFSWRTQKTN